MKFLNFEMLVVYTVFTILAYQTKALPGAPCYAPTQRQEVCGNEVHVSIVKDRGVTCDKGKNVTEAPCYDGTPGANKIVCLKLNKENNTLTDPTGKQFVPLIQREEPPTPVEFCRLDDNPEPDIMEYLPGPPTINVDKSTPPSIKSILCPESCKDEPPPGHIRLDSPTKGPVVVPLDSVVTRNSLENIEKYIKNQEQTQRPSSRCRPTLSDQERDQIKKLKQTCFENEGRLQVTSTPISPSLCVPSTKTIQSPQAQNQQVVSAAT